ncbi:MAG: MBL fold metallo-hydrolase [Verrucomicrobiae bacterium]|nr:MBL fold metallo-hydrolase [Verrucomicrobiae bacterium]
MKLEITKYEQSALIVATDSVRIAIDFGSLTPKLPNIAGVDAVLISHEHADHYHPDHVRELAAPVWAAREVVEDMAGRGLPAELLSEAWPVSIGDITVTATEVDHGPISKPISNLGLVIDGPDFRVFVAGDMKVPSPLPENVDVLCLPVGDGKVFGPREAANYVIDGGFRSHVIPLHYHGKADPESVRRFTELAGEYCAVLALGVGESFALQLGNPPLVVPVR